MNGKKIKEKRLEKNLTLESVANKIGISKATLQRYESGIISNVPSDKIEKIARALNCSPSYLMGWEDEEETLPPEIKLVARNMKNMTKSERQQIVKIVKALAMEDRDDTEASDL